MARETWEKREYWDGETILDWVHEELVLPLSRIAVAVEDFNREVDIQPEDEMFLETYHEFILVLIKQARNFRDTVAEKYPPVLEMEAIEELEEARKDAVPF